MPLTEYQEYRTLTVPVVNKGEEGKRVDSYKYLVVKNTKNWPWINSEALFRKEQNCSWRDSDASGSATGCCRSSVRLAGGIKAWSLADSTSCERRAAWCSSVHYCLTLWGYSCGEEAGIITLQILSTASYQIERYDQAWELFFIWVQGLSIEHVICRRDFDTHLRTCILFVTFINYKYFVLF